MAWPATPWGLTPDIPLVGARVLVLRQPYLDLILWGQKTIEIRHWRMRPGIYYLGHKGQIYGVVEIGVATKVQSMPEWRLMEPQHRWLNLSSLPYKATWANPILQYRPVPVVPFTHNRGAIGVVVIRA